jgi:hypothetical protein
MPVASKPIPGKVKPNQQNVRFVYLYLEEERFSTITMTKKAKKTPIHPPPILRLEVRVFSAKKIKKPKADMNHDETKYKIFPPTCPSLTMNVSASSSSMQESGPYELKPARDFAYSNGVVTTFKYISLSLIE